MEKSKINNLESKIPSSPWLDCQVCHDTRRIVSLSKDMIKAIRKLRRDLQSCKSCSTDPDDCPIRKELNTQINTAIQSVVDELHLQSPNDA